MEEDKKQVVGKLWWGISSRSMQVVYEEQEVEEQVEGEMEVQDVEQ